MKAFASIVGMQALSRMDTALRGCVPLSWSENSKQWTIHARYFARSQYRRNSPANLLAAVTRFIAEV
jgi:hypothetical protein